jgi:probable HAF family extracellular repeat protein
MKWLGHALQLTTLALASVVPGIFIAVPPARAATYAVVELDTLPEGTTRVVRGLNDAEEVVGGAKVGRLGKRGFFLTRAGKQAIPALPDGDYGTAFGINEKGEVVGSANAGVAVRAFRSLRTTAVEDLGTLPGDTASEAFAINKSGEAVGYSSGATGIRAVVWPRRGGPSALPALSEGDTSKALAINDNGQIVGVSESGSGLHAVLWSGGTVQDLGTLAGQSFSEAVGINGKVEVVGSSGDPAGARRAVLWVPGAPIRDLGVLTGGDSSRALGINDRTEVVGTSESSLGSRAFVWTAGGMQDLNTLVTAAGGFVLTEAVAINKQGTILAAGRDDSSTGEGHDHDQHELPMRVFLLIPNP